MSRIARYLSEYLNSPSRISSDGFEKELALHKTLMLVSCTFQAEYPAARVRMEEPSVRTKRSASKTEDSCQVALWRDEREKERKRWKTVQE